MDNYLHRLGKPTVEVFEVVGECRYRKEGHLFTMEEMVPAPLCPFAYHNLIPYIITLLNNGWFRWVKRERHTNTRYLVSKKLFEDSSVNRAFPNEVLVQCPNPRVSVVFGVGVNADGGKKTITVRLLSQNDLCPMGHKEGDNFKISEEDIKFCPLSFNSLFPYMLLSSFGKSGFVRCPDPKRSVVFNVHQNQECTSWSSQKEEFEVCFTYGKQKIRASSIKSPCRYHSNPVDIEHIAPVGLCLDALHVAYPYGLALLYDASFAYRGKEDSVYVRCPSPQNGVVLEVKRVLSAPKFVNLLKTFAANIFEALFYPVDIINCRIVYTVSDVKGSCPAGHRIGEQFEFNIWNKNELCPASFHSLFPHLFLKNRGVSFRWQEGDSLNEVSCPDCQGAAYRF